MSRHRCIERGDIMSMADYSLVRKERRSALIPAKKLRRVEVGPFATFYFENYETMWLQVHEMLFIEKGGDAQIDDELSVYNPLIPQGRELIATMMLEIDDPARRDKVLKRLGGIEKHVFFEIQGPGESWRIQGEPTDDTERTTPEGKTSSVHFFHFRFSDNDVAAFSDARRTVILGVDHPNYGHMAVVSPGSKAALAQDFG
ncbi:MAG: DUF3501 family protein [Alphaproteobacteria bacterium]|nr:DUF3501 family protein [Alphaproteobacteria bacterium]